MDYTVLPRFSLVPNKLSLYNQVYWHKKDQIVNDVSRSVPITTLETISGSRLNNAIVKKFHNFTISPNAYRTLKQKINWLYYYAKPRHVKTYNDKNIYNFKMAFITLTLPSKQIEPTHVITSKYFNQFLTEVRQRVEMKNFVWRLEFQKNGNVHYHLVTDTYLDYYFIRGVWNRILKKGGYVQEYQKKHKNLTLGAYIKMYPPKSKDKFNQTAKRFAKGCANNWLQPNSVDVKSVTSGKSISYYISKYFGKNATEVQKCNILDTKENSKSLRLWFCSRSLSKLKTITDFCEAVDPSIFTVIQSLDKVRIFVAQYAKLFFFDFKDMSHKIRRFYAEIFTKYMQTQSYNPAI